jgi:hypothetical protein
VTWVERKDLGAGMQVGAGMQHMWVEQSYSTNCMCVPPRWRHPLSLARAMLEGGGQGGSVDGEEASCASEIPPVCEIEATAVSSALMDMRYIHVYMYIYIYVYKYVYTYVIHTYAHTHTHTHTNTHT